MLRKASRAGHVKAQARLAKLLWFGGIGVDRKREQANDLAKSALRHPAELTTAQVVYLKHFLVLQHEEARTVALQRSAMELHEAVAQAEVALANEAQEGRGSVPPPKAAAAAAAAETTANKAAAPSSSFHTPAIAAASAATEKTVIYVEFAQPPTATAIIDTA